jgi:flagellar FliJ protein
MKWAQSLIRLSTFEVETIQKRLSEVAERRMAAEMKRALLEAEGEAEAARAGADPDAGWGYAAYVNGLRLRKQGADAGIALIVAEEQGVRDALALAFEAQKKYEQVAETARVLERKEADRRESAMLDELGLRRAAGGR